jgi:DNA-directed RNA polymerase subunit RPC12/RpoP
MQQPTPSDDRISLRCPNCQAKLRTSRRQIGQRRACPRCRHRLVVQPPIPSDADVALVGHEVRPSKGRGSKSP